MKLQRFTLTERLFHWAFAIPILLLAGSGTMMVGVSLQIITVFTKESLLTFHTWTGFTLIILPILVALRDRKIILSNVKEFVNFTSSDRLWLVQNFVSLIKSKVALPLEGKFNGGQKVNALLMMGATFILCASGLTMLAVKGALIANLFHAFAFSLFAMLFPGHFFLATINPSTRPAFMAIITGDVDAKWLEHHHFLMFKKLNETIFDDIAVDHANKNELEFIHEKVYKDRISTAAFNQLSQRSEAMLVARRHDSPVAFMQVVGDGNLHGYIAEYNAFSQIAEDPDFVNKFIKAAESVTGHTLSRL